ncbi:MAG: hypothetical protein AUK31_06180 [Fibrobacteres bacterium CG2_30_45_31]|nr:MAG: hypothetical protein AUK31_06180 [Fibrobacteres bacterium CG2_30_45_31]
MLEEENNSSEDEDCNSLEEDSNSSEDEDCDSSEDEELSPPQAKSMRRKVNERRYFIFIVSSNSVNG